MSPHINNCSRFTGILQTAILVWSLLIECTNARIGYFWHITDLHLDTIYSTEGDVMRSCWRIEREPPPSSSTHSPGRYGDYLCDSPWSLIESAAKAMKSRQGDNVEFVLWTGDGLSHSAHPMNEMKKLEILRNITDLLGRTFSSQFVFPVLGHEDGTTTNFRHMGELWRHWLPTEALHTFEKGGYYSIEQTKSRLRIIALNTNFMRHDPKYSQSHLAAVRQRMPSNSMINGAAVGGMGGGGGSDSSEYKNYYYHHGNMHQHHGHAGDWSSGHGYGYGSHHRGINVMPGGMHYNGMDVGGRVSALSEFENQDTEKQWIWLEEVLSKSKANKETVYIVGHIPPGSDERHIGLQQNGHTTFTESNNKRYLELVRKYASIIQGQFFGHLHSDSFRIIYDDTGKPVSWMMLSPSVTPRKMSVGSNNPAMRLYKFDTDSGQVLDYTQYYMDLQNANLVGEPNWVPEYNLTHYYALSDISAITLHNFVERFTSNDGSWFAKYYRANSVRYQTDPCGNMCMLNHYCAITRVDYKEFRQCLEKEQSALRSNAGQLKHLNQIMLLAVLGTFALINLRTVLTILHTILRLLLTYHNECQQHVNACRLINTEISTLLRTKPTNTTIHYNKDNRNNEHTKNLSVELVAGSEHGCKFSCMQQKPMNAFRNICHYDKGQSLNKSSINITADSSDISSQPRNNEQNVLNIYSYKGYNNGKCQIRTFTAEYTKNIMLQQALLCEPSTANILTKSSKKSQDVPNTRFGHILLSSRICIHWVVGKQLNSRRRLEEHLLSYFRHF
ncbi:acid sphingomyelinase-like phosphodiesterase 3b [Musca autumnalis]|uniref:acid sphingomyelinase-like phosphodiesterase 3b n=1 Tax=Musca autumnalis TaxID=221902 RepID=UPI003CE690FF